MGYLPSGVGQFVTTLEVVCFIFLIEKREERLTFYFGPSKYFRGN